MDRADIGTTWTGHISEPTDRADILFLKNLMDRVDGWMDRLGMSSNQQACCRESFRNVNVKLDTLKSQGRC